MTLYAKIIAVDFDGCLVDNQYPNIGSPCHETIRALQSEKLRGARVILWTFRVGKPLADAVSWCHEHAIPLDAVNKNLPEVEKRFGVGGPKVFANEYWDDKAVRMPTGGRRQVCVL